MNLRLLPIDHKTGSDIFTIKPTIPSLSCWRYDAGSTDSNNINMILPLPVKQQL
ncbi:protein of unknown function [Xenorhabdus doucetiae]|uniref:Uncharacterized protein n=1 Tax=Xenorhabdus doucetiae TaxID=351671 RepID=A0A068QNG7_9GAMM|nr:hypothetical protein LY16_03368 [Xenorhabdus doucetiae]CDG16239.1 protein of unknown function [Xenorhabdus doucetiae]